MLIDTASFTDSGGRDINEDSLLCRNNMFIVADGLGGHDAGEEASAAAIDFIEKNLGSDYSETDFINLFERTNEEVRNLGIGALTTTALAVISDDRFHYANVGDSRVYLFRNNRLFAHTKDHSVCQVSVDMGELEYEDIRGNDDRSKLLKVLGNPGQLKLNKMYQPIDLMDGDAFIVCSDGFWENIYETEMELDLLKSFSAEQWMNCMLKRLMLKTEGEGDNYSVICGIVHTESLITHSKPKSVRSGFLVALIIALLALIAYLIVPIFVKDKSGSDIEPNNETTISETILSDPDEPNKNESDTGESDTSGSYITDDESQIVSSTEVPVETHHDDSVITPTSRSWLYPDTMPNVTANCVW
ncbi:MAG: serine/threonine-protein phosphatase [Oscillospiraceae bacterium]|nr:serine/threonine-protein phosphatase [Oscillospiraceae bacterium]